MAENRTRAASSTDGRERVTPNRQPAHIESSTNQTPTVNMLICQVKSVIDAKTPPMLARSKGGERGAAGVTVVSLLMLIRLAHLGPACSI
jgi:hypothetical protein